MKKQFLHYIVLFISLTLVFSACKKDEEKTPIPVVPTDPTSGLTMLSDAYALGAATKVEVWSKDSCFVGYNTLYLFLKDSVSGAAVKSAAILLHPTMDMGSMTHESPYENPAYTSSPEGKYECAVVFIMSSAGGSWSLNLTLSNHDNGLVGLASIPLTVDDLPESRVKSFISQVSSETLFVTLVKPENPVVGINDLEVLVHKRLNGGNYFPADTTLDIEISPLMVSMGHGSPNNVNPAHVVDGHYRGSVNYTMSGDWQINFTFRSGGQIANNSLFFETLVP